MSARLNCVYLEYSHHQLIVELLTNNETTWKAEDAGCCYGNRSGCVNVDERE